jgi:hypothetical protein
LSKTHIDVVSPENPTLAQTIANERYGVVRNSPFSHNS